MGQNNKSTNSHKSIDYKQILKYVVVFVSGMIFMVLLMYACGNISGNSGKHPDNSGKTESIEKTEAARETENEQSPFAAQSESSESPENNNRATSGNATSGNASAEDETEETYKIMDRKVYLTFDDGPSENTGYVLDLLKKYNIKATFFVIGREDDESAAYYRRIIEEGHTLAMHSYTHNYNTVYADIDAFKNDVDRISALLTEKTGVTPVFYRFPGGSSNTVSNVDIEECKEYLLEKGISYFDWNVSSGDGSNATSAQSIIDNVINGVKDRSNSVVLMHDSISKNNTMEALESLIIKLNRMEVEFLPITEDTKPVRHR